MNGNLVPILVAVITVVPATIAAIAAIFALKGSKDNKKDIGEIHYLINSRMEELLKASKGVSFAEGERSARKEGEKL